MTPDEYRQLDAEVAERIFGGPQKNVQWYWWEHSASSLDTNPGLYAGPEFSARIENAWTVVEHLQSLGWSVVVEDYPDTPNAGPWRVIFFPTTGGSNVIADADTPSLAICRGALRAVSGEGEP